ncbi:hypothetical protein EII29_09485, partial [Leptotrichia sp. OH3620_COT-345]
MKKTVIAGILAISALIIADSAKDVLRKAREDYYKQQREMTRPVKEKKVSEKKMKKEQSTSGEMLEESVILEEERVEEVKPK